ncbi:hypothetical protein AAC387_Pa03g3506 [Persea americana]
METIHRISRLLFPLPISSKHLPNPNNLRFPIYHFFVCANIKNPPSNPELKSRIERFRAISSAKGDLFPLPQHLLQPAREVDIKEIGSEKIIEDMISVMRKETGVGLSVEKIQIGIPLKVLISSSKYHHVTSNPYLISLQQTR